jgi:hypothetical protein
MPKRDTTASPTIAESVDSALARHVRDKALREKIAALAEICAGMPEGARVDVLLDVAAVFAQTDAAQRP